jgi:hypothetical protein
MRFVTSIPLKVRECESCKHMNVPTAEEPCLTCITDAWIHQDATRKVNWERGQVEGEKE